MIKINPKIELSWKNVIVDEFQKSYFHDLKKFLLTEKNMYTIYPKGADIFNAFKYTPFNSVKVVIIGQDPYHGKQQAHGLSFSVPDGIKPPPSLQNILKELANDFNTPISKKGDLSSWAKQGVLLLNATLTVREKKPGSHQKQGWEKFTDRIIKEISNRKKGVVFLLWGKFAQNKIVLINESKHHVLMAPHPSPFSAYSGFFGSKHFSKANTILKQYGKKEINWNLL